MFTLKQHGRSWALINETETVISLFTATCFADLLNMGLVPVIGTRGIWRHA